MFGLGMGEMVVIVVIAIVLFGTTDLPKNLRKAAKGFNEFKKVANDAQRQWNEVRDDVARTIMSADLDEKAKEKAARVEALHAGETPADGVAAYDVAADDSHPSYAGHEAYDSLGSVVGTESETGASSDTGTHTHTHMPAGTVTESTVYTAGATTDANPSTHGTESPDRDSAAAPANPAASAIAATVAAAGPTTAATELPAIRPAQGVVARKAHEAPVDHSDAHHEERGKEPLEAPAAAGGIQKSS